MENKSTISESKKLQTVLELPYLAVYLNQEAEIFELYWLRNKEDLSTSEFKIYLEKFSQLFEKYSVKGFYVDSRDYHIVMDIQTQVWHDKNITPRYIAGGVEKIAFLLPYDYIPALTIEQTFDEPLAQQLTVRYFEDEDLAREWIFTDK